MVYIYRFLKNFIAGKCKTILKGQGHEIRIG